jgi:regulator of replication initiation timing
MKYVENKETFINGTYNGKSILIREKDGYINVGKLCRDYNREFEVDIQNKTKSKKDLYGFKRGKGFVEILKYWNEFENLKKLPEMYELKKNYTKSQGTYLNPDLIHFVVDWISIEYAFKVKRIMNAINEKGKLTNNPNYIDDHLKDLLEENEKLRDENDNLKPRAVLDDHKEKYYVLGIKDDEYDKPNKTKITFHRIHEDRYKNFKNIDKFYESDPKPIAMSYFHEFKKYLESNQRKMYEFDRTEEKRKLPTTIIFNNMILDKVFEDLDKLLNEFEN